MMFVNVKPVVGLGEKTPGAPITVRRIVIPIVVREEMRARGGACDLAF